MSGSTLRGSGPPRRYCLRLLSGITLLLTTVTHAAKPTDPPRDGDSVDLGGGYVENMGFVSASDAGVDFTNETLRHLAVSIGQLGGVDPETGDLIGNEDLLSLVARELNTIGSAVFETNISIYGEAVFETNIFINGEAVFETNIFITGNAIIDGIIFGSGEGLSDIPADNITGSLTERPDIQDVINSIGADISALQLLMEQSDSTTDNPHQVTAEQLGALACSGGSMTGDIDMSGAARVINLPEPLNDEDAVSKGYLERRMNRIEPQGDIGMGIYTNRPGL